ncbi:hypothetical protein RUND412_002803 [Rhizina undulata]
MNHAYVPSGPNAAAAPSMGTQGSSQFIASQLRLAAIVLTGLNVVSAACMGSRIVWDARQLAMKKRLRTASEKGFIEEGGQDREREGNGGGGARGNGKEIKSWWRVVPVGEVFPLVLALGIIIQGILLGILEGKALRGSDMGGNCQQDSVIAWTALWIVPYIVLTFTFETTIRAVLLPRFKPRSTYVLICCISACLILTILTWIPSRTIAAGQMDDVCTGQLMSYVDQFAGATLGLTSALLPTVMVMALIIFLYLRKEVAIAREERISASRVIYFAGVSAVQWTLMIPNYVFASGGNSRTSLSFLATVIVNSSGIVAAILDIYLRANLVKIRPRNSLRRDDDTVASPRHTLEAGDDSYESADDKYIEQWEDKEISVPNPSETRKSTYSTAELSILETPRPHFHNSQSRFSRATVISLHRLGEEITSMIAGLQAAAGSARSSLASPRSPHFPLPHISTNTISGTKTPIYSLFPPKSERYKPLSLPVSKFAESSPYSTPGDTQKSLRSLQSPSPARRAPPRPNRGSDMPLVNFDRRSPTAADIRRHKSSASSTSKTSRGSNKDLRAQSLPLPMVLAAKTPEPDIFEATKKEGTGKILPPPPPREVAIPPLWAQGALGKRFVDPDAESFQEIVQWK